jgi:hypothetical protein
MDHKQLMNAVIALAVIHLVLSAIVGYLLYSGSITPMHGAIFCGVSVVVNVIILALAAKCRSMSVSA